MASIAIVRNTNSPLDGLSTEEAAEFKRLDALAALDEAGRPAWIFEGEPTSPRERRWLELYTKQTRATRRWNSGPSLNRNRIWLRPAFRSRSK